MAMTSGAQGNIVVTSGGVNPVTVAFNPISPTTTKYVRGEKIVAQATSNQAIPVDNMTVVYFVYIKARNTGTGAAQYITVRYNGTTNMPQLSDTVIVVGAVPGTAITSLDVTTQAAVGDTTIEYLIAGI